MESKKIRMLRLWESLEEAAFRRWVLFNSFALFWYVIVFPVPLVFQHVIFTVIAFIIMLLLLQLDLEVKFSVAERSPKTFLKIENMKTYFSRAYWLLLYLPSIAFLIAFFLLPKYVNEISSTFVPVFLGFTILFFGATFYQMGMVGNVRQQPRLLRARAGASFRVLSDLLLNPSTKKHGKAVTLFRTLLGKGTESYEEKKKQIRLFENGMSNLNELFINLFNFEFCNPNRYSDYFRFVIWSEDSLEIRRIRKELDVMGYELKEKELDVSEILWTAKQTLTGKPFISREELFQDLDFKTGLSRWYNHNKETVKIALPVFSLIVSILALLARFTFSV